MKHLFLSIAAVAMSVLAFAQEPAMTFDFTPYPNEWGLPIDYVTDSASYTKDGYTIAFTNGTVSSGHKAGKNAIAAGDTTTFLLYGKTNAKFYLPVMNFPVSKIVYYGKAGASTAAHINVFVNGTAVSTEHISCADTAVFVIDNAHQAAGTQYYVQVTSKHNAQCVRLDFYEAVADAPATPTFSVPAGTYLEAKSVELACATEEAEIRYTLDGTDPTAESTLYTEAIQLNAPTEVRAIAIKNGVASEVVFASYNIVLATGAGTEENPFTISDVVAINSGLGTDAKYWVKGVIVGYFDAKTNQPVVGATDAPNSNVALALGTDTIPVQVSDSAFRANVNLKDHPVNVGCELAVKGHLVAYFSRPGVKDITSYVFEAPETALEQAADQKKAVKFVKDGQIYIRKGDMIYNIFGQEVK